MHDGGQTREALSKREEEVAAAYAKGGSYKEIARELGISPQTVRSYLSTIYRKLGVSSKLALAQLLAPETSGAATVAAVEGFPRRPERPSIAVLAFENMSGDPEQEYFSDGISDDIITALSRSPWLFVIARNSGFSYKGQDADARRIAQELGVRFVLEGGVRRSGDRVRVTARLIDGDTSGLVWTERYDGEIADVFDLQDEITRNVVASIQTAVHLRTGERPIERKNRPDLTIWELTMRAWRLLYQFNEDSYAEATELLERALEIDNSSAEAHFLLSLIIRHQCDLFEVPDRAAAIGRAYDLALRATVLDVRSEYAQWALGITCWMVGKHDDGIAALERAVELNPNCSLAYGSLGSALAYAGRGAEAIENQQIAIRSNPRDPSVFYRFTGLALAHYVDGRFDEAIAWAGRAVQRMPEYHLSHAVRVASFVALEDLASARDAVAEFRRGVPGITLERLALFAFKEPAMTAEFFSRLREAGLASAQDADASLQRSVP
ncbi:MAG: LuxR C-terminal-related transcriptional regulator [Pseudomonadota bacterium]